MAGIIGSFHSSKNLKMCTSQKFLLCIMTVIKGMAMFQSIQEYRKRKEWKIKIVYVLTYKICSNVFKLLKCILIDGCSELVG